MKIKLKQSIKEQLDNLYWTSKQEMLDIDYVELTEIEYIQFLEELGPTTQRILLNVPGQPRKYKGLVLKVLTA